VTTHQQPAAEPPEEPEENGMAAEPAAAQEPLDDTAPENAPTPEAAAPEPAPEPTAEDFRDRWMRALADLDNTRKRQVKDLARERAAERARVAAAWLPVVDNLDLALAHAAESDPGSIVDGVKAVRDQAVTILTQLGYPRIEQTGVPFDPLLHEAVGVAEDPEAEPGTVIEVLRPGYGEAGSQLRPMTAVVSKRQE
jgi:molecular chaperone GrpE